MIEVLDRLLNVVILFFSTGLLTYIVYNIIKDIAAIKKIREDRLAEINNYLGDITRNVARRIAANTGGNLRTTQQQREREAFFSSDEDRTLPNGRVLTREEAIRYITAYGGNPHALERLRGGGQAGDRNNNNEGIRLTIQGGGGGGAGRIDNIYSYGAAEEPGIWVGNTVLPTTQKKVVNAPREPEITKPRGERIDISDE